MVYHRYTEVHLGEPMVKIMSHNGFTLVHPGKPMVNPLGIIYLRIE